MQDQLPKEDLRQCAILIVEDDYLGRVVLKEIFKRQGFCNLEEAENGKDALAKIESFRPDLVILDVIMPEMDGIECCKRIRKNSDPKIAGTPVLFQTSLDGMADKARLFEAGASDYLTKPIDPHEITARATVHLEREVMTKRLQDFKVRMTHELDTAKLTQRVLIPNEQIINDMEREYNLQICSHYRPCSELGGDFWGFKSLSFDELAIYTVDFSGHGVNAALNTFRLHALMQGAMDTAHSAGAYLTNLNAVLAPMLPVGQFATMFYGVINKKKNKLSYASAAAPTPVLFRNRGESFETLDTGGTLLGAFANSAYETAEIEFVSDDMLFLYSDALIETPDPQGYMQPIEHWVGLMQSYMKQEKGDCRKSFAALIEHFQQQYIPKLNDDLTLNAYFHN